jgi:hypothetical protein
LITVGVATTKEAMLQIVFNEISAAEISQIPTLEQLDLLGEFQVSESTLQNLAGTSFGIIEHDGKSLYRFRAKDYRIYFEILDGKVVVHRVLDKNSFSDFLFRSKLSNVNEDEILKESKTFWKLIEEGKNAQRK